MKKFMIAALAAGMLTACSDSAVVEAPANGGAQWGADGTGYVSLNISLPSSAVGRANDQFSDGLPSEYKVKDAVLVLFAGSDENAAEFEAAYKLPINFSAADPTQITSTSKITKRINAIESDNIYALVLLNAVSNGLFNVTNKPEQEEYKTSGAEIKQGGTMTALDGKTFTNVKSYIEELPIDISKGLIMLNAPLTNEGSTSATAPSGDVTILAKVDKSKIKSTASEAAESPAADIYVERNSAKVTLEYDSHLSGNTAVGSIPYQVKGIALDNTNTKSYIVRNVKDWATWRGLTSASTSLNGVNTRYRFAAADPVKAGTNLYRIYWAEDVNYATNSGTAPIDVTGWTLPSNGITTKHTITQFSFTDAPTAGYSAPLYCLENTFNVVNMDWVNTTRAILKVHFGNEAETVDMVMWNNDAATFQKHSDAIDADGPMAKAIAGMSEFKAAYDGKTKADISVTIAHEGSDPENVYRLASITVAGAGGGNVATDSELFKAAKEYFGAISYYKGGMGYYQVRIKHFMDDLTPWNLEATDPHKEWTVQPKAGYVDKVYPGLSAENYLGRYGVVRNNWYNLKVTGVKIIGTPYIEDVTSTLNKFTPDDEMKSYITVNINILSWAKRDQGVELQ